MLYTLVIMMALSGSDHRSGGSVDTHSVSGFTTKQACENAVKKLHYPQTYRDFKISYTTSCVAMSI